MGLLLQIIWIHLDHLNHLHVHPLDTSRLVQKEINLMIQLLLVLEDEAFVVLCIFNRRAEYISCETISWQRPA